MASKLIAMKTHGIRSSTVEKLSPQADFIGSARHPRAVHVRRGIEGRSSGPTNSVFRTKRSKTEMNTWSFQSTLENGTWPYRNRYLHPFPRYFEAIDLLPADFLFGPFFRKFLWPVPFANEVVEKEKRRSCPVLQLARLLNTRCL